MKNLEKDSGGTVTSDMSEMYKCLLMDFVNFDGSSRGAHGESHGLFSSQMSEAFARHFWPCSSSSCWGTCLAITQLFCSVGMKERKWSCSVVSDSVAPWTVACQAPPSMEFSRQEYWSGLPFPSPGNLPDPGIEPGSPALQADVFTVWATREARGYRL